MKFKGVLQHDKQDCGAACLVAIFKYYGISISMHTIREQLKINNNGASIYSITKVAQKYNFETEVLKGSLDELIKINQDNNLSFPIIVHQIKSGYTHFIVLLKIKNNKYIIFDPEMGRCKLSINQFKDMWSGYIICLNKGADFKRQNLKKGEYMWYWNIIIQSKINILVSILLSIFLVFISIFISYLYKYFTDNILLIELRRDISLSNLLNFTNTTKIIMLYLFILIIQLILSLVKQLISSIISFRIGNHILEGYQQELFNKNVSFYRDREAGEIISRISDTLEVIKVFSNDIINISVNIFFIIILTPVLFRINYMLFLPTLVLSVLFTLIIYVTKNKAAFYKSKTLEEYSSFVSKVKENIQNIEFIKTNQLENFAYFRINKVKVLLNEYNYKLSKFMSYRSALLDSVEKICSVLTLVLGMYLVFIHEISLGSFFAFEMLKDLFLSSFQQIPVIQASIQSGMISIGRLNDIIFSSSELLGDEEIEKIDEISVKKVHFSYNLDEKVLDDLTFTLRPLGSYEVIGENGVGKSTLFKLLVGFYKKDGGDILFNSTKKIENIKISCLRNKIKYLSSECNLFSGTVIENLTFRNEALTESEIKILEGCDVLEIIHSLPDGINTVINEGGTEFSSGQRQKLLLAQIMITNPDILILDEAMNHIDTKKAIEICKFILEYRKNKATFIIEHNSSIGKLCDNKLLINKNKVNIVSNHR